MFQGAGSLVSLGFNNIHCDPTGYSTTHFGILTEYARAVAIASQAWTGFPAPSSEPVAPSAQPLSSASVRPTRLTINVTIIGYRIGVVNRGTAWTVTENYCLGSVGFGEQAW